MEQWISLFQNLGVAIAALIFLGWASTKVAPWLGARIDRLLDRAFAAADKADQFDERLAACERRTDELWAYLLRRGRAEAVSKGVATMNSPVVVTAEAKAWFAELAADLHALYRSLPRPLADGRLAEEIERKFGDEITRRICIPREVNHGACLVIAVEVAREGGEEQEVVSA